VFIFITLKFGAYLTILGLSLLVQSMIWTCLWTGQVRMHYIRP